MSRTGNTTVINFCAALSPVVASGVTRPRVVTRLTPAPAPGLRTENWGQASHVSCVSQAEARQQRCKQYMFRDQMKRWNIKSWVPAWSFYSYLLKYICYAPTWFFSITFRYHLTTYCLFFSVQQKIHSSIEIPLKAAWFIHHYYYDPHHNPPSTADTVAWGLSSPIGP